MKIVFVSNYFTHHQSALAAAFDSMEDVQFHFLETERMEDERKAMGWEITNPSYVLGYDEKNGNAYRQLIDEADVVIIGSAPARLVKHRLRAGKLTFFSSLIQRMN